MTQHFQGIERFLGKKISFLHKICLNLINNIPSSSTNQRRVKIYTNDSLTQHTAKCVEPVKKSVLRVLCDILWDAKYVGEKKDVSQ